VPYYVTSSFLVAEGADGHCIVFPPSEPPGGPLKKPTGLFGVYSVTGPLKAIHRNLPPKGPTTKEAVNEWLLKLRQAGCSIYPGDYEVDYVDLFGG